MNTIVKILKLPIGLDKWEKRELTPFIGQTVEAYNKPSEGTVHVLRISLGISPKYGKSFWEFPVDHVEFMDEGWDRIYREADTYLLTQHPVRKVIGYNHDQLMEYFKEHYNPPTPKDLSI